jgi:hypothetical protein
MSHSPPVPAGNQSPYPLQEPPHYRRDAPEGRETVTIARSRWSFLPVLTATISVVAAFGAVAIMLMPDRVARES